MKSKSQRKPVLGLDRRPVDVDSMPHTHAETVRMVDPVDGRTATYSKSLRDNPLDRLHLRKQIDDCQFSAGDWMRAQFELFGSDGVRAMDFGKDFIDGGGNGAGGITDAQIRAGRTMKLAKEMLGTEGFALVIEVLARRKFIEQIATERGQHSQRDKDYLARRFRECLNTLAIIGGFMVSGADRRTVRDAHSKSAQTATKPELHRALTAAKDAHRLEREREAVTEGRKPVDRPPLSLSGEGA